MIHGGYWLLLTVLFAGLLFIVQRAERSRRLLTFVILLGVGYIIAGYGIYRISRECGLFFPILCGPVWGGRMQAMATNTVLWALIAALIFNALFWLLIGRYNPPPSSEEIKVLGLND